MSLLVQGFDYLTAQTFPSLLSLFWFVFIFDNSALFFNAQCGTGVT